MLDRDRFMKNLLGLVEMFGEPPMSEFRILAYFGALEAFTDDQVERAMNEASRSLRFFPKPVELVELIQGKQEDRALTAWEQLQQAVSRAGAYQSVLFEDPKIARVIKILGGWEAICLWPVDELQHRRREFLQAYKDLPAIAAPPQSLGGICDRNNAALGHQEAPPVFIAREARPALRCLPAQETSPPVEEDQIPLRDVMKSMEDVFAETAKEGWLLKH